MTKFKLLQVLTNDILTNYDKQEKLLSGNQRNNKTDVLKDAMSRPHGFTETPMPIQAQALSTGRRRSSY